MDYVAYLVAQREIQNDEQMVQVKPYCGHCAAPLSLIAVRDRMSDYDCTIAEAVEDLSKDCAYVSRMNDEA